MRLPFQKTFRKRRTLGLSKAFALALAVLFENIHVRIRYLPKKTVVNVNGSKMIVFPRKGGIDFELYVYKKREALCTNYLQSSGILKTGDVVLDAGANIGYYALLESQLVGLTGQVYAVEPVYETFCSLTNNIKLNNRHNINALRYAFGNTTHMGKIYVSSSSNLSAVNKQHVAGKIVYHQDVPFLTVDDFLKGKITPKLVRMDVEGYEYEIIQGMNKTLTENVFLMIEVHPAYLQSKLDDFLNLLNLHGFRVRFAVFEGKVKQGAIIDALFKKERR
jgi:FkbM family methyltransferase